MSENLITAKQQKFSAQILNWASICAVLLPPLILLWIAASIFTYAAIAHHPNQRVVSYLRPAGYRFYGLVGSLVVILNYTGQLRQFLGGSVNMWLAVWVVSLLVILPLGFRDIYRVAREDWQDMRVATE